jgi:hypothetical protein
MKDKTVQDIMVPVEEYPCIPDTLTIGDAVVEMTVQILRTKHLSLPRVALVFDEDFADPSTRTSPISGACSDAATSCAGSSRGS